MSSQNAAYRRVADTRDIGTQDPRLESDHHTSHPMPAAASVRSRPLLLVDVDGVISLFGFDWSAPPPGQATTVDGLPHWISATAGPLLRELAGTFELVWCTGWEDRAPEHLPRLLGLDGPAFPHLVFAGAREGRHWKLDAIEAHAGPERPVAWIDDDFDDSCDAWLASRPGPTLLVRTDPAVGITAAHVARLRDWAAAPA